MIPKQRRATEVPDIGGNQDLRCGSNELRQQRSHVAETTRSYVADVPVLNLRTSILDWFNVSQADLRQTVFWSNIAKGIGPTLRR